MEHSTNMTVDSSFSPNRKKRSVSSNRARVATAEHAPRQSRLLAGLPAEDYERLLPHLELVALPLGAIIHGAGDAEKYLYFITEGIVSRVFVSQSGASAGFAVTGKEGVIGVATFLGGDSMPSQAVVTSPGFAYRLRADALADGFDGRLSLRPLRPRFPPGPNRKRFGRASPARSRIRASSSPTWIRW